jgi:hypothetical protein
MILSACAHGPEAPTPYQPYGEYGGYYDQPLGGNRWLVSFRGNAYTSQETATAYAYRRASEVCRGDFDLISERSFDKVEVQAFQSWGVAVARDSYVKPRRQLVIACKHARQVPAVSASPAGAVPVGAASDVDAGSGGPLEAPVRDIPF